MGVQTFSLFAGQDTEWVGHAHLSSPTDYEVCGWSLAKNGFTFRLENDSARSLAGI